MHKLFCLAVLASLLCGTSAACDNAAGSGPNTGPNKDSPSADAQADAPDGQAEAQRPKVHVFLFQFDDAPELNATFSETQVRSVFESVNQIWGQAQIQWKTEVVSSQRISVGEFPKANVSLSGAAFRAVMEGISPAQSDPMTWNVVFIRKFPASVPAGGVYLAGTNTLFFAELSRSNSLSPFTLAHELGHSLGLAHEDSSGVTLSSENLMTPGKPANPNYGELMDWQISIARKQMLLGPS